MDKEYIYNEDKNTMIAANIKVAVLGLEKQRKQLKEMLRNIDQQLDDIEAAAEGHIPSAKSESCKIYGVDIKDWMFNPVNIGNCHDCPFKYTRRDGMGCHAGAEVCIVRQLCELNGSKW